jgi:hypothetical protein
MNDILRTKRLPPRLLKCQAFRTEAAPNLLLLRLVSDAGEQRFLLNQEACRSMVNLLNRAAEQWPDVDEPRPRRRLS